MAKKKNLKPKSNGAFIPFATEIEVAEWEEYLNMLDDVAYDALILGHQINTPAEYDWTDTAMEEHFRNIHAR